MANPTHVTIIGAGPGGYPAAFLAADLGMQVTLIDEEKNPGGICVYRGCIPSKALLHVAKVLDEARHATHVRRRVRRAADRHRQDARVQGRRRREDDRRHRPAGTSCARSATCRAAPPSSIRTRSRWRSPAAGKSGSRFDVGILATGSRPIDAARPVDQPRARCSTRPARSTWPARRSRCWCRRRLHRPRARIGLRGARHQGVGRRDDAGPAARRRPRPGEGARRRASRPSARSVMLVDQGREDDRRGRRRARHVRSRRTAPPARRSTRRSWCRSAGGRTATCPGLETHARRGRQEGLHHRRRAASHRRAVALRDRRRGRRADAGAQGDLRGQDCRRGDCRPQGGLRAARHPGGGVHRSRAGLVRAHRERGQARQHPATRCGSSRGAPRAGPRRLAGPTG